MLPVNVGLASLVLLKTDAAPALVEALARALGPWQSRYSDSKLLSTSVVAVHTVALLFGGGLAIAADRTTLRVLRARGRASDAVAEDRRLLGELGAVHRPVLTALAVLVVSGVLLAAADVKTYALSWVFWLKLALFVLLLVNGAVLERAESGLRGPVALGSPGALARWRRLRAATWTSLALWTATTVVGVALTSVA
ncbi:MAG TPA: hypothetical protein VGD56_14905 [Gemmatirosa sp.]